MKLCFGTYANVLLRCGDNTEKKKLLNAIVKSVDDTCSLPSNAVTLLLQCAANLPDGRSNALGNVISGAESASPKKVAAYFSKKVIPQFLAPGKRKLAVLAIRELIANDAAISGDTVVELVSGTTKNALLMQSKFVLSDFLAGVFLYVAQIDNKAGKAAADEVTEAFVVSFAELQETISFRVPQKEGEVISSASPAFIDYMENAREKYENVKTLLYSNEPRPFYDFYVPNQVIHTVGRSLNVLANVNAESLIAVSNFIILAGTGGLGKSMMVRHLLLNAIDSFPKLRRVPVLLPLKDYSEAPGDLEDFVFSKVGTLNPCVTREDFDAALAQGLFLLLFDGLDEIDGEHSVRFEREIETLTDKYPANCFVISSRPFQSFISFARFSKVKLQPFTKNQALALVDKLDFRSDEPAIKGKFQSLLQRSLFNTHRSFVENPLLLTIMLLTFDKFADIPTKMHVFYRKAFLTLSETHDADKGGYRRAYKSGLSSDVVADYFAEFCFHTYKDGKFEFTEQEFIRYYNVMQINDKTANVHDFIHDICVNLCLMFQEGGKYHFSHRSFQEYFCALFLSKQKEVIFAKLGGFFEKMRKRMYGDHTFNMLYDMVPDKVETLILIPYLQELFDRCDKDEGYWTFLKIMYPCIRYEIGEVGDYTYNAPQSYLFDFIIRLLDIRSDYECGDLPEYESLVEEVYGYLDIDEDVRELVSFSTIESEYPWVREMPDVEGARYMFSIAYILDSGSEYLELIEMLNDNDFLLKCQYTEAREYLEGAKKKQANADEFFLDLL